MSLLCYFYTHCFPRNYLRIVNMIVSQNVDWINHFPFVPIESKQYTNLKWGNHDPYTLSPPPANPYRLDTFSDVRTTTHQSFVSIDKRNRNA